MLAPARADLYWNPGGAPNGAGTWDAASTNWNNASDGTGSQVAWDSSTAVFSADTGYTGVFTVTLSGTQNAAGVTFEEGTVTLSGSDLNLTGSAILNAASGVTGTVAGIITGSAGLTKTGDGTVRLGGVNTFTGTVAINGGVLSVGADSALGDAANSLSLNGATLNITGPLGTSALPWTRNISLGAGGGTLNSSAGAATFQSGVISGSGDLTKSGTVSYVLGSANTYSGKTIIRDGALISVGINSLGDNSVTNSVVLDGGTLRFDASYTETRAIDLVASSNIQANGATIINPLTGNITGGAGFNLTKTGSGTITLAGTNTYAGNTIVSAGTLIANSTASLPGYNSAGAVSTTATGATLAVSAGGVGQWTSADIDTAASNATIIANGRFGVNVDTGNTYTHTGMAGAFNFVKLGDGELILGGTNTYTGSTIVTQGTLKLTATDQLPTTALTVNGGTLDLNGNNQAHSAVTISAGGMITGAGTLTSPVTVASSGNLAGTGTVSGTVTVNAGGKLGPGDSALASGTGTLSMSKLTLSGLSLMDFNLDTPGTSDLINVIDASGLTLANAGINITPGGSFGIGTYNLIDYDTAIGSGSAGLLYVNSGPAFKYSFQNDATNTRIQLVVAAASPTQANASWNVDANGNWDTGSNWTGNAVPEGIDAVATFGSAITADRTVTVDGAVKTVGTVNFNNANRYSVSGNAPVTFDVSSGNGALNVISGSHTWNPPTQLNDPTTFDIAADSVLTVGDVISSGSGAGLTKTGLGQVTFNVRPSVGVTVNQGIAQGSSSTLPLSVTMAGTGVLHGFAVGAGNYGGLAASGAAPSAKIVFGAATANSFPASTVTGTSSTTAGLYSYFTTLTLSGSGGRFTAASVIDIFHAGLTLANATNQNDRIGNNTPVILRGAELRFQGHATAATTEVMGQFRPGPGGLNYVTFVPGAAGSTLQPSTLNRLDGGVALVRGVGLGTNTGGFAQLKFSSPPTITGLGTPSATPLRGIIADDSAATANGTTASLATHDANGVRMLTPSEYTNTVTANTNFAPDANATIASSITLNAIELGGAGNIAATAGNNIAISSGQTLTLSSGMIYSNATSASTISGGTLSFSGEGVVANYTSAMTISSVISATGLSKVGNGNLSLTGSNNFGGGHVNVNEGILIVNNVNRLNNASKVTVGGVGALNAVVGFRSGQLQLTSGSGNYTMPLELHSNYFVGTPTTLTSPATFNNQSGNNTWSGDITLAGRDANTANNMYSGIGATAGTLTLSGQIRNAVRPDGHGEVNAGFYTLGTGDIVFTGSQPNTWTNFIRPFGGRLIAEKDAAFGAGIGSPVAGSPGITAAAAMVFTAGSGATASKATIAFRAPASSPGGFNYATPMQIHFEGVGRDSDGVFLQNLGGHNTFAGHLSLGSSATIAGYANPFRVDIVDGSSLAVGGVITGRSTSARALIKDGGGQLIFTGDSTVGTLPAQILTPNPIAAGSIVDIRQGGITIGGADGKLPGGFGSFTVRQGANLTFDNQAGVNTDRINSSAPINLSGLGAELKLIGHATANTTQSVSTLSVASFSTVTSQAVGTGITELALPSSSRSNRGTVLFRGMDNATSKITLATSTLRGGGGSGTLTSILPEAVGDTSVTGIGTDFVTVDSGSVRALTGSEYKPLASGNSTHDNTTVSSNTTINADTTVNSIKMDGGTTISIASGKSLYAFSGAILGVGTASSTITGGDLRFHQYYAPGDWANATPGAYENNPLEGPTAGVSDGVDAGKTAEIIVTVPTGSTLVQEADNVMAGSKGLTKSGGGTLRLKGSNTFGFTDGTSSFYYYDGSTATQVNETVSPLTINAGRLEFETDNNLGYSGSPISINGGTLAPLASSVSARDVNLASLGDNIIDVGAGGDFKITGQVSGNALTKNGPGILELTNGTNNYGGTVINDGFVRVDTTASAQHPELSGTITLAGGSLLFNDDHVFDKSIASTSSNTTGGLWIAPGKTVTFGASQTSTISMTGSGNYAIDGGGTFVLAKNQGTNAQMSYTGSLIVNGGSTLMFEANGAGNHQAGLSSGTTVPPAQWVILNDNSRLRFNVTSSLGSDFSSGTRGITVNAGGGKIDIVGANIVNNHAGIFGTGTITKEGTGQYRLRVANNSFSGKWNVAEGTLEFGAPTNNAAALGTGSGADFITIQDGATLRMTNTSGTGTLANNQGITLAGTDHTIAVISGTILTVPGDITAGAGKNLIKTENGALRIKNYRGGDVTVSGGTFGILPNATAAGTSKFTTLTTDAGAKMDLTNNKMVLTNMAGTDNGAGRWNGTAYDGVTAMVIQGQGTITGGIADWDGTTGITSSTAAANKTTTTIAVAQASDVGKSSLGGQSADADDTLVMFTYLGDANMSGNVDADDYFAIDSNYNKGAHTTTNTIARWAIGDFNYDGKIDGDDYAAIDAGFSGQGAPIIAGVGLDAGAAVDGVTAVPEPGSLSLIALGAASLLRRRRRQS